MDLSNRQGRREQGQRIQRAVEKAGLSVEELAGRIGCSRALIYQYLSGSTLAQPDRLQHIARECGVPLTWFYADDETSPPASPPADRTPAPAPEAAERLETRMRSLQDLADAQQGPPDHRALVATCESLVALAATLGDLRALSAGQFRLGNALLSLAEYPRAADALTQAVATAAAADSRENEIDARQSLGKAYFLMGRLREAREQFALIAQGSEFRGRWQGALSLGGLHELQGEYRAAMQRFDEAAAILEEGEAQGVIRPEQAAVGLLYVNTNRRNVYMNGGDFAAARPLAEKGLADAEALGNADQHLEARFDLAWCDWYQGRWAEAWRGFTSTLQLARFTGDQGREQMARAWLGILYAHAGDRANALTCGKEALAVALANGDRRAELYAHLALADAWTGASGGDSEARYHTGQALAITVALRYDRSEIECRLRLARLATLDGDATERRDNAERALTLAQRLGARHLECLARLWNEPNAADTAAALTLAQTIGANEALWRAEARLGALALEAGDDAAPDAERHFRQAIVTLEALRQSLLGASLPDTLLENDDCAAVYLQLAAMLLKTGRIEEANAFLEQTGWPPLQAQLNRLSEITPSSVTP